MSAIQFLSHSMQAQWRRHEVLANNIANVSTPSFKKDDLVLNPPEPTTPGGGWLMLPSSVSVIQWTDFAQGAVRETGRNLDVAINGPGFFVVQTAAGERYTRAGSLSVGPEGTLVGPSGDPIVGQRGGPVRVSGPQVTITGAGDVVDGDRVVDTLKVVDLPRPYPVVKVGNGLYALDAPPDLVPTAAKGYEISAGALEGSNVSTMESMVTMVEVLRTYEAAQRALQAVDEVNARATNEIGRTP
jgi:flagellar basal-body rod protein FlgG